MKLNQNINKNDLSNLAKELIKHLENQQVSFLEQNISKNICLEVLNQWLDKINEIEFQINSLTKIISLFDFQNLLLSNLKLLKNQILKLMENLDFELETKNVLKNKLKKLNISLSCLKKDFETLQNSVIEKEKISNVKEKKIPITEEIYQILLLNAGHSLKQKREERTIQLKLVYRILYHTGLKISQINEFKKENFDSILEKESLIYKNQTYPFPKEEIFNFKSEIDLFFNKYKYSSLGSGVRKKDKILPIKKFITFVNEDMAQTVEKYQLNESLTSHNFRVGFIGDRLEKNSVEEVQTFVGFKSPYSIKYYGDYQKK
jgi:integrase